MRRGDEGFVLEGASSMRMISRDRSIRYPRDRSEPPVSGWPCAFPRHDVRADQGPFGAGQATHAVGDIVTIATPKLGALVNRVDQFDRSSPDLRRRPMRNCAARPSLTHERKSTMPTSRPHRRRNWVGGASAKAT
jgi:fumarylacetoacetate (FAA) hydrolase family protein